MLQQTFSCLECRGAGQLLLAAYGGGGDDGVAGVAVLRVPVAGDQASVGFLKQQQMMNELLKEY